MNLIDWLDDVAARDLRQIPLTEASGSSAGYCLADWERAFKSARPGRRSRALSGDGVAASRIELPRAAIDDPATSAGGHEEGARRDLRRRHGSRVPPGREGAGASVLRRTGSTFVRSPSSSRRGSKWTATMHLRGSSLVRPRGLAWPSAVARVARVALVDRAPYRSRRSAVVCGWDAARSRRRRADTKPHRRVCSAGRGADYLLRTEPHSPSRTS